MRIDFHTHGRLTKKSSYDQEYFINMIDAARESGLDAIVLTEHFNTSNYYLMYDEMEASFKYRKGHYFIHGIKVFMGLEVDVEEGGHFLLAADRETVLDIRQQLDEFTQKGHFIPFDQLMDLAQAHQCLTIAAHCYRGPAHLGHTLEWSQLQRFDALDLNATDQFLNGRHQVQDEVEALAAALSIGVVTGSDSHYPVQLGSNWTEVDGEPNNVDELRDLIRAGHNRLGFSEILEVKVFAARTTKAHLKSQLVYSPKKSPK